MADEHQVAGGRERAGVVRIGELERGLELARGRIERLEAPGQPRVGPRAAAGKALASLHRSALVDAVLLLSREDLIAAFYPRDVEQAKLRIIGAWFPVLAAGMSGAEWVAIRVGTRAMAARGIFLHILGGIVVERAAGLGIEAGRPVELVDVLLAVDERAVDAVERIEEPVAGRVHDHLAVLAIDLGVDDRVLGNLVVVVGVVRGVLEAPLDLAVARRDREHARRPLVIAGPVFGVPVGAGVANALIERVGVGVIGGSFPDRRPAVLPAFLAVLPGLVAGLAGTRDRVGAPDALPGVEIGAVDEAADAVFAAGGADDGHIAHDQGSR